MGSGSTHLPVTREEEREADGELGQGSESR